ncbi:MAG: caspase family protein [Myxococcota bacterium]
MKTPCSRLLASLPLLFGLAAAPASAEAADAGTIGGGLALSMRAPVQRFALVIGSNATLDDNLAPLRFADDDAASVAELLAEVGYDVELVTSLDQESQALHPDLVRVARTPSPAGLETAWEQLRSRMDAAPEAADVELLIYYSGHGDVGPDGQGYLTLDGGKLTRNRLFSEILSASPADHNHVLIDACRSEQFVLTRGKTWKNDRGQGDGTADVGRYLGKNHLGGHPDTGVIVAHSADQQTHEWERYRGGIFTHQLLSGLRGGADLNGDGAIEYSELGAFVAAANSGVKDPRARLSVTVRPPKQDERRPVLQHDDIADQRVLYFPQGTDQRLYTVEDERGVRVADLRRAGDQPGYLRLPDGDVFVSRRTKDGDADEQEATIAAHERGLTRAESLEFRRTERAARGALDQAFRSGLFLTPFGPGYYSGYTDTRGLLAVEDPTWRVEVWEVDEDGNETKVAETEVEAEDADEAMETEVVIEESGDRHWWDQGSTWGALFFGTVLTPQDPSGELSLVSGRVPSDSYRGCLSPDDPNACSVMRGFDLRWQVFRTSRKKKYPGVIGYFRTGYTGGHATFSVPEEMELQVGDATAGSYVAVPVFLGGNVYAFDHFPLRPYAGMGFGFDVIRMRFERFETDARTVTKARIGFELHAGIEARITNYVALNAEVMQQWGARKRLDGLPDFANRGFSMILGVAVGFPVHKSRAPRRSKTVVKSTTVKTRKVVEPTRVDNPMSQSEPEAPAEPAGSEAPVQPQPPATAEPPAAPPPSPAPPPPAAD